jgi:phosphatidylserine/phosphatidylglycerophosphate/cardiolipin synthase-like enzyme
MKLLLAFLLVFPIIATADVFPPDTHYQTCFTPGNNCTQLIVDQINQAKQSIEVQSYSFTSKPIALALVKAAKRGVKVQMIFDKSQFECQRFSYASYFIRNNIPVWDDADPDIAHNKVMIFDRKTVETGSFNFTKAAQKYNAENVLIIQNSNLAGAYYKNWQSRQAAATTIKSDSCPARYYY